MDNDISDLINNTLDQKPDDFASTFNNILIDKLKTAVENKKIELAQTMFAPQNKIEDEPIEEPEKEPEEENG